MSAAARVLPDAARAGSATLAAARLHLRLLEDADIGRMWGLFEQFHAESRYRGIAMDRERVVRIIRQCCFEKSEQFGFIIAELGERVVGFLYCSTSGLYFCERRVASVLALYVTPAVRGSLLGGRVAVKLLHAYRNWAGLRRVVEIQVHVTHGFNLRGIDKLLRKMRFRQTGGNYSMAVGAA